VAAFKKGGRRNACFLRVDDALSFRPPPRRTRLSFFTMEYRGKYNPKIVFPSFSLVVNRYILRRPVRRVPSSRLVWINVPEYRPRPVSVRDQRMTDWAMTTIDRRDEAGAVEDSHAGVLALTVSCARLSKRV